MSEILKNPELLPSQKLLKSYCDAIRGLRPSGGLTFNRIGIPVSPRELEQQLCMQPAGKLLLADGESFSITDNEYYPDINLRAGRDKPVAASLTAWIWNEREYGRDSDDWSCQLDLELWYQNQEHSASQSLSLHTGSYSVEPPSISRQLGSSAYAETGYEGHGFVSNKDVAGEYAVMQLLGLLEPMVDDAVEFAKVDRF